MNMTSNLLTPAYRRQDRHLVSVAKFHVANNINCEVDKMGEYTCA